MGSVNNLTNNYLLSAFDSALQSTGLTQNTTTASATGSGTSAVGQPPDNSHLSPLAQVLSTLQQLQQTDPTEYAQLTGQIATNLQNAAKTAQSDGDTGAANQLNKLATDFQNASQSGQLPNIQDLAKAVGGHHHHGHHASPDSDSDSTSSTASSTTSSSTSAAPNQFLAALQSTGGQSGSLNPATIILNTLASSGVTESNS